MFANRGGSYGRRSLGAYGKVQVLLATKRITALPTSRAASYDLGENFPNHSVGSEQTTQYCLPRSAFDVSFVAAYLLIEHLKRQLVPTYRTLPLLVLKSSTVPRADAGKTQ